MANYGFRRLPECDKRRMVLLHKKGLSTSVIAKRFGCSTSTVRYVIKDAERDKAQP